LTTISGGKHSSFLYLLSQELQKNFQLPALCSFRILHNHSTMYTIPKKRNLIQSMVVAWNHASVLLVFGPKIYSHAMSQVQKSIPNIISIVKPTRCVNVSNLFYFGMTFYMFWTVFPSIMSSRLYIQKQAFVIRYCCLLASR